MAKDFPPRGYFAQEFPMYHEFTYKFSLQLEDVNQDSTIATLIHASEANAVTPESVNVNPSNGQFAENNGPLCHMGSIVPKMSMSINAFLSIASAADIGADKPVIFNWMPLYTSFENSLTAVDDQTSLEVEDIIELQHDATNKDTTPLFSTANLDNVVGHATGQPLTTEPPNITDETFDDYDLSVDTVMESVAFNKGIYFDHMRHGTNKAMLRKVAPHMNTGMVSARRPFKYFSNNFTYPAVKRMNPFTFCGILFHVPEAGATEQPILASETTVIEHIFFTLRCRYPEWNPNFDQTFV